MRWLREHLGELERAGLRRSRRTVKPLSPGTCEVGGRRMANFASNDYLGLAGDERLGAAARKAIGECGVGAGASALVSGRTMYHEQLEQQLAQFKGTEAALLFPTGYAANVGTIAALIGKGDVVFSDQLNHASLIDGCRLSRATVRVYPHGDVDRLAEDIMRQGAQGRRLIVTDGVFSMDGDVAPLRALAHLAEDCDAILLIDDAHGTGVLGEHGRGACEHFGVESANIVHVGTLSKAVGALGGFVTGSHDLIEYLWNRARTQVFSTALPPSVCAAAGAGLEIIRAEPERRDHLRKLSRRLRESLWTAGVCFSSEEITPIVPVVVGDASTAVRISEALQQEGVLAPAIRPPTVPVGSSRLRISLSAAHTVDDVDELSRKLIAQLADPPTMNEV